MLTDNSLQFSTLRISAPSNASVIYLSWKNNTWTTDRIYDGITQLQC